MAAGSLGCSKRGGCAGDQACKYDSPGAILRFYESLCKTDEEIQCEILLLF